eukprot:gnl/Spiro4/11633_TR6149_c0_g1_i1.p1 gnl/Spiro4/11633_TR6149_c0_g1~~gnl/Spiro4/11633_TR6149_c0_g1_i1.p1  ORF type:complete len:137 (-),score=13.60 gnl/Spiro4/11633_TR6149_c0_g1_i1:130-540(-)
MMWSRTEPKLADFGSAAPLITRVDSHSTAVAVQEEAMSKSTSTYRAPELFDAHTATDNLIDGRADIWSVGCVAYAMVYDGKSCCDGSHTSTLGRLSFPTTSPPISPPLIEVIRKCLSVSSGARPQAAELVLLLQAL